jgi:nicotinamide riboside kinase
VPWIADGVRDREDRRHEVQALFRATLARFHATVTVVQGTWEQRLATATALIDSFTDPYHHG